MEELIAIALTQNGLFTTAQARRAGLDAWALVRLVRAGRIEHLARGLYALTPRGADAPADGPAYEAGREDPRTRRHRRLARGGLLLYPDAALSHDSALIAHGLPVWRPDPERAHLVRPVCHQVRTQHFVIDPRPEAVVDTADGPAVAPSPALVQTARARGILAGVVAADAALRSGVVTPETLAADVAEVAGWPGSAHAESMLAFAEPTAESPGESVVRVICTVAGLDLIPQFAVRDEDGEVLARLDFRVRGTMVGIEFDGRVKYGSGPDALWAEKRREDALRRRGYVVVRITWADLSHPERIVGRIRAAIRTAAGSSVA